MSDTPQRIAHSRKLLPPPRNKIATDAKLSVGANLGNTWKNRLAWPLPEKFSSPEILAYLWSGHGSKKSCVGDYQRAFKKLYELAAVKNGHMHGWRDSFAVELPLAGVQLEQVSVLLGHQSIK